MTNHPKTQPAQAVGLAALDLPSVTRNVALDHVREDPENARQTYDPASLKALAESIRSDGLLTPIIVRPDDSGAGYVIVAGHRRVRAARSIGLTTLPAIVRGDLNEEGVAAASAIENLMRDDLQPYEQALALQRILAAGEFNQKELAERIGLSVKTIQSRLALLEFGPVIGPRIGQDGFTIDHAKAIAPLADAEVYSGLRKTPDEDEKLRAQALDVALKAIGTGKDALTSEASVAAVADAIHAAGIAYNMDKDRKLCAEFPAYTARAKKLRHVELAGREGASAILVFEVDKVKEARLAYKGQSKAKGRAEGGLSKADKAKLAKRQETVRLATDTQVRDAILAAKPSAGSMAWLAIQEMSGRILAPGVVDFALRVAGVTSDAATSAFKSLFARPDPNAKPAEAAGAYRSPTKWWDSLTEAQQVRLLLGLNLGNSASNGYGAVDGWVKATTNRSMKEWRDHVDAQVKDEVEPIAP